MSEQSLESNRTPDGSVHPRPLQSRHKSPCILPSWDLCYILCNDSLQREPFRMRDKKMNRVSVIVWNPACLEELEPVDPDTLMSGNSQIITAPASEDKDVVEEVVENNGEDHDDKDLPPVMKDMYDFLGELSEKIQTFRNRSTNPGQPPAVPDDVPTPDDEDVVGDIPEDAKEDTKQVLRDAVQSLSRLNDGLRSVLSLSRDTSSAGPTDVPEVDVWDTGKATEQEYRLHPDSTMEEIRVRLANQVWNLLHVLQERVDQHTYDSKDIELISGLQNILVLNCRLRIMTELELNCHAV